MVCLHAANGHSSSVVAACPAQDVDTEVQPCTSGEPRFSLLDGSYHGDAENTQDEAESSSRWACDAASVQNALRAEHVEQEERACIDIVLNFLSIVSCCVQCLNNPLFGLCLAR
jgi:hypothetical protein